MSPQLTKALVKAAERVGGERNLTMPGGKTSWEECVTSGCLWFNDQNDSTHVVKLEE